MALWFTGIVVAVAQIVAIGAGIVLKIREPYVSQRSPADHATTSMM
jgi:hypothetical protein